MLVPSFQYSQLRASRSLPRQLRRPDFHRNNDAIYNMEPDALLSHLPKADGSATFSYAGYRIIGSVNGPIEVQRKDEILDEAFLDVVVRPAAGVGGLFLPRPSIESCSRRAGSLMVNMDLRCSI